MQELTRETGWRVEELEERAIYNGQTLDMTISLHY
jgi:hypothetical protein